MKYVRAFFLGFFAANAVGQLLYAVRDVSPAGIFVFLMLSAFWINMGYHVLKPEFTNGNDKGSKSRS